MIGKVSKAYRHHSETNQLNFCRIFTFAVMIVFTFLLVRKYSPNVFKMNYSNASDTKLIKAITWNVAAINNNPFEYWITNDDPDYNKLMSNISRFVESPGDLDISVKEVFTDRMFEALALKMTQIGWKGVEETKQHWLKDYRNRKIISEFLKDGLLGKKRLASMPDRVTNTIQTTSGKASMRPTVINCFDGDLSTQDKWWQQWSSFFFDQSITVKRDGTETSTYVYQMISTIQKSKYPSITVEEEAISVPLQTMCMAIFDAILVHMMNTAGPRTWQPLRSDICQKLNRRKNNRTVEILQNTYGDADVQFLQEVAGNFPAFTEPLSLSRTLFDVHQTASMDTERDQNSYILLKKGKYSNVVEITDKVVEYYAERQQQQINNGSKQAATLPVANGDLIVLIATDNTDNTKYMFASFHGDTNGLATKPVVGAVRDYAMARHPDCKLLFGLDANTYAKPEKDQQGVVDFGKYFTSLQLNSCYGPAPNPLNFTTFHARTHLQPQLNKAVSLEDKDSKGDKNPKDFILFFDADFQVVSTNKDNTGKKIYIENMVFPTLSFPSDHGITSTVLRETSGSSSSTTTTVYHRSGTMKKNLKG